MFPHMYGLGRVIRCMQPYPCAPQGSHTQFAYDR
uniref:Uncharacterized protein n=1 Tax=Rhizophora mucronata TaxID=61149 RepID=A0A2P2LQQ0_RHIMU